MSDERRHPYRAFKIAIQIFVLMSLLYVGAYALVTHEDGIPCKDCEEEDAVLYDPHYRIGGYRLPHCASDFFRVAEWVECQGRPFWNGFRNDP